MKDTVSRYIKSRKLLDEGARHLVALSGGADSVCLLLVLKALGYNVEAVHCNFHLRGEESDRDENYCRKLCESNAIPLHLVHFDTRTYAELHKVSIELAARDLRYGYFERLRQDIDAADICVAHHKNDSVETVIMNMVRGTGLKGLMGIQPRNGHIIRPLLCVDRAEILQYLNDLGQDYVTDSSNLVNDVTRNKLRLDIIPQLESINAGFQKNVIRMTESFEDVGKVMDWAMLSARKNIVADAGNGVTAFDIEALCDFPSIRYFIYSELYPLGFTTEQINDIAQIHQHTIGKSWSSATHTVAMDRGRLLLAENRSEAVSLKMPIEGLYVVDQKHSIRVEKVVRTPDFQVVKEPWAVSLDADKVRFPLTLRNVKAAEKFKPFGMKGMKLVSDYMTDRKLNYFERKAQMVLADADDNAVWLVGQRADGRFCIDAHTINCLLVRYINNE